MRGLATFLVLFFGLGPLTAVLPASDDARLPPCCRKNGTHHCSMSIHQAAMHMAEFEAGSGLAFDAPSHCPFFPGTAALLSTGYAMLANPTGLPAIARQPSSAFSPTATILSNRGRTVADRGPPRSLVI